MCNQYEFVIVVIVVIVFDGNARHCAGRPRFRRLKAAALSASKRACAACRERLRALNGSAPMSPSDKFELSPVAFIHTRYAPPHAQIPTHVVLFEEHVESLLPTLIEWRFEKVRDVYIHKCCNCSDALALI